MCARVLVIRTVTDHIMKLHALNDVALCTQTPAKFPLQYVLLLNLQLVLIATFMETAHKNRQQSILQSIIIQSLVLKHKAQNWQQSHIGDTCTLPPTRQHNKS